jgi:hypothetical protein
MVFIPGTQGWLNIWYIALRNKRNMIITIDIKKISNKVATDGNFLNFLMGIYKNS